MRCFSTGRGALEGWPYWNSRRGACYHERTSMEEVGPLQGQCLVSQCPYEVVGLTEDF